jgi:hypothetical protein
MLSFLLASEERFHKTKLDLFVKKFVLNKTEKYFKTIGAQTEVHD